MPERLVSKAAFASLLDRLIAEVRRGGPEVIGVKLRRAAGDREVFVFGPLARAAELRLDYDVTLLPPKQYLQPPREDLLRYSTGLSPRVEEVTDDAKRILVGVHPYDLAAINQMDRVFAADNPDPAYLRRRANTTIIASNIQKAGRRAFADQMGTTRVDRGFDLFLTDIGDSYVVTVGSEKGAALLAEAQGVTDADAAALARRDAALEAADALYTDNRLNAPAEGIPDLLRPDVAREHPVWREKSDQCFSCGSCNLVCPTCYCFDVRDETALDLASGVRYRTWDGCLLTDFAKVATGENFREERIERFQHRFYRKGLYLYDKFGELFCVGCGRCATACLPDIANPVAVFNALQEGGEQS